MGRRTVCAGLGGPGCFLCRVKGFHFVTRLCACILLAFWVCIFGAGLLRINPPIPGLLAVVGSKDQAEGVAEKAASCG